MYNKDFKEGYDYILNLWPSIVITSIKDISAHGGANIPTLLEVYDRVDEQLDTTDVLDAEFLNQISWAFYTVVHKIGRNTNIISMKDININDVYEVYLENLV